MSPCSPSSGEPLGRCGVRGTKNASSSPRRTLTAVRSVRREDAERVCGDAESRPLARSGPAAGGAFNAVIPARGARTLPAALEQGPFPAHAWPRRPRTSPFPGLRGPQLARASTHPSPTQSGVGGAWGSWGPCRSDPPREADSVPSSRLPWV